MMQIGTPALTMTTVEGAPWVLIPALTISGQTATVIMATPILGVGMYLATSGQIHHPISRPVHQALDSHPQLSGQYQPRDPRFTTEAIDKAAHNGYQTWHRQLDAEVQKWLADNPKATTKMFEDWLRWRYSQPDLQALFPNGF
jgi:hypothetical protein